MPGKKREAALQPQEESFPRGGGTGLAPIVHRQIAKEAYNDAKEELFGTGGDRRGKKRRKSAKVGSDGEDGDEEDAFFKSLAVQDKLPKFVELLKFRTLNVGTKLWGSVAEITPKELIIALPHGLRGHVAYQNASDVVHALAASGGGDGTSPGSKRKSSGAAGAGTGPTLSELFTIGQLVRCAVSGLRGSEDDDQPSGKSPAGKQRKRVDLTLQVSRVNSGLSAEAVKEGAALPACVRSVEDHGYLLTFGIKGTSGFLPKKDAPGSLRAGSLVDVVIKSINATGAAIASADRTAVAAALSTEWDGLNIGSLLPGALVTARVRNVLSDGVLASFLTFFTGTVDPFHLGPVAGKAKLAEGQRVKARILFVDPETKRVGLTLLPHLVNASLPASFPPSGQVFEAAEVVRVDPGLGVLLNLAPGEGAAPMALGYAHISNLSDEKVDSLEGKFRPRQIVRCRVIGTRPMDGLAAVSLKPSVVEQSVLSVADITPGMPISATVGRVEETMLLLQVTPHLRALVPSLHMSDVASKKAHRKFKEGQKVSGRVLAVDPVQKKVTVTLKPALVDSKLPIMARAEDAVPGARSHGMVTGVKDYGVFVSFYNDMSGLVAAEECGLPDGQSPQEAYAPGQVVKCRVLGYDTKKGRLKLSLVSKKKVQDQAAAADPLRGVQLGSVLSGVVSAVHKNDDGAMTYADMRLFASPEEAAAAADENAAPLASGRLDVAHLADHPVAAQALGEILAVGMQLDGLLVLQKLEKAKQVRVSRKASLVAAAAASQLPDNLAALVEGAVIPGYIASVAPDGAFVRFLGDLTGRAGLAQLSDTFVSDPHAVFSVGQSVRAQVAQVDAAKGRFSVTLKQSLCGARDGALLRSFFADADLAHRLGAENEEEAAFDWAAAFPIGGQVKGQVHGVKDYGLLCDLDAHSDVVGLAAPHQTPEGTSTTEGTPVTAIVLDSTKKDGIVDLSLRADLLSRASQAAEAPVPKKKKQKKGSAADKGVEKRECKVGDEIQATVELAKVDEGYCVVSLPEGCAPWVGFLSTADYNLPATAAGALHPQPGDIITATVAVVPGGDSPSDRLILVPSHDSATGTTPSGRGAAKAKDADGGAKKARPAPAGTVSMATVTAVHALHADVTLESGGRGRIYITEVADPDSLQAASPLKSLSPGATLKVVVLGRMQSPEGRRHGLLELCGRPSVVAAAEAAEKPTAPASVLTWGSLKPGQKVHGYVQEVANEFIWLVFGPTIRGRAFIPHAVDSLEACTGAAKAFKAGQAVNATILSVAADKHALDVAIGANTERNLAPGSAVLGLVASVEGTGVKVKIGPGSFGRVALTEIHDRAVANALRGIKEGHFVKVAVVSKGPKGQFELSLRPSKGGECSAHATASAAPPSDVPPPPASLHLADLKAGQRVSGYVKSCGPNGVFICISSNADARIRLRQLSDEFVEDPGKAYPAGTYVEGTVLSVEGGRVDLTLRRRRPPPSLDTLEEGQVVRGKVRKVEKFGVFVELDGSGAVGLAHVSELADGFVKDVAELFKVDQRVAARVLSVDKKAGRLSLGLKPSYLEGESDVDEEAGDGTEAVDFDDELQEAIGGGDSDGEADSEDDDDGSEGEGVEGDDSEDSGEDFDLDEDLLEAEASEGDEAEDEEEESESE